MRKGNAGFAPRTISAESVPRISPLNQCFSISSIVMRTESLKKTPHAMLSRAVCGIRGRTLIINLPGSLRAAKENLAVVMPAIPHAVAKICGSEEECGR